MKAIFGIIRRLARAYAVNGEAEGHEKYFASAKEAGEKIEEEEDKKLFMGRP